MPGCPGACTWAKVALVESLDGVLSEARAESPNLKLNVHVDDIAVALAAPAEQQLVNPLLETLRKIQLAVEHEVPGVISPGKAGILASTPALGKAIRRGLGSLGGKDCSEVQVLGADVTAGRGSGTAEAKGGTRGSRSRPPAWVA